MLAAVTLMALGAIYSRGLAEGGLRHALASTSPTTLNAQVVVQNRPLGPADYGNLRIAVEETIESRLGFMRRETHRFGRAPRNLPLVKSLEQPPPQFFGTLGQPFFLTGFEDRSRLVEGRWPSPVAVLKDAGVDVEVVLGIPAASSVVLGVGDRAYIFPFRSDPAERIALTVVGLAEPADPLEEYWMGGSSSYFDAQDLGDSMLVPIYFSEGAFLGGLGARYPGLVGDYGWILYLDTGVLTASTVDSTRDAVAGLDIDINKQFPRSLVLSGLDRTLSDYEKDLRHARVPIFLFISLVVVVILYFLALVTGMLAGTRTNEASLLRSRGASMIQVGTLLAIGEGIFAVLAVALGPFLALVLARFVLLRTIDPVGGGGPVSVGLSADVFILAAVGGLLSLGVLVASGMGLARLGMVESLRARARPPTVPFLQRYYVDLGVLAAVGLIVWQIQGRGGFIEREVLGRTLEAHPSLLLGPVLVMVAAAFLLMRILPIVVRGFAWVGYLLAPAWISFALVRLARDPLPHGSLAIILMMAAALGVFGATFQSTLSRSQREEALYRVGGEVVIVTPSSSRSVPGEIDGLRGVGSVTPIERDRVTLQGALPGISTTLLIVDPDTLSKTAWFRDDFAGKGLAELLSPLSRPIDGSGGSGHVQDHGLELPADATSVGLWANSSEGNLSLWMRLSDARGRYHTLSLGDIPRVGSALPRSSNGEQDPGSGEWRFLDAPLPDGDGALEPPINVVSVYVGVGYVFRSRPSSIAFDDITVKGRSTSAEGMVVEGFEDSTGWAPMPNGALEHTTKAARSGERGLVLTWKDLGFGESVGILIPPGPYPLPAIGGPMFYVGQELGFRRGGQMVPIVVRDVTDYFPTTDPTSTPLLIISAGDYDGYILRLSRGRTARPAEYWVSLEDGFDRSQTLSSIVERLPRFSSLRDRDAESEVASRDPLGGGGWNGLTILGVAALTLAVMLALGAHVVASLRSNRIDLTVAGALGLSRRQIVLTLALERLVVAALGLVAGGVMGAWLARWVLGFLDLTASGRPMVPPMMVTAQDWLIILVFVVLAACLTFATLLAAVFAQRVRPSDVLRAGQ